MSLTFNDIQRRAVLAKRGLDPELFDINRETGGIEYRPQVKTSPAISPTPEPTSVVSTPPAKTFGGAVKAGARSAFSSLIPSAAGLATGAAAGALAGSQSLPLAAIPVVGPFIPPVVGLGTGLAAAYGASKVQEKLLPDTVNQQLAQDVVDYPKATAIGNIAGSAPFLRFSPTSVYRAGKTAGNMLMNQLPGRTLVNSISKPEVQNLANVALGAGVGAGQSLYEGINSPEGIDLSRLLINTLGNAAFNDPNRLGQKLLRLKAAGPLPDQDFTQTDKGQKLAAKYRDSGKSLQDEGIDLAKAKDQAAIKRGELPPGWRQEIVQAPVDPLRNIENNIISPSLIRQQKRSSTGLPVLDKQTGLPTYNRKEITDKTSALRGTKQDVVTPYKSAEESAAAIEAVYNPDNLPVSDQTRAVYRRAGEEATAEGKGQQMTKQPESKPSVAQSEANRESNYQMFKNLFSKGELPAAELFAKKLGESYYFKRRYSLEKQSGGKEPFGPLVEGQKTAEQQRLLDERRKNFQPGQELPQSTQLKENAQKAGNDHLLRKSPTKGFYDLFNSIFADKRNVRVGLNNELVETLPDGTTRPARGAIDAVRKGFLRRVMEINPSLATPDTLPHEYTHGWFSDLKESPNINDRRTAETLEKAMANSEEIKTSGLSPEELLAETGGYEILNRAVNLDGKNGTLGRAWKDFLSRVRLKWGKANPQDVANFVSKRFLNDPDFVETHITPVLGRAKGSSQPEEKTTDKLDEQNSIRTEEETAQGDSNELENRTEKSSDVEDKSGEVGSTGKTTNESEVSNLKNSQPESQGISSSSDDYRKNPEAVSKMTASEFKEKMSGFTRDAFEYGASVKGQPEKIAKLREYAKLATDEFMAAMKSGRFDDAMILSTKPQYFNEALQAAEGTREIKHFQPGEETTKETPVVDKSEELPALAFRPKEPDTTVEPDIIKETQARVLDSMKETLEARDIFREIKVGGKMKSSYLGVYRPSDDKSQVRPNNVETALHESIHRVLNKNKKELIPIISQLKFEPSELRDLGEALLKEGSAYRHHKIRLDQIAGGQRTSNVYDEFNARDIYDAFDEAAAQLSDGRSNSFSKPVFEKIVTKIAGPEMTEFLQTGSRDEKYFPKYEEPMTEVRNKIEDLKRSKYDKVNELFNQERETEKLTDNDEALETIRAERRKLFSEIDELQAKLNKVKKKYPGRYYQPSVPNDSQKILSDIDKTISSPEFSKENIIKRSFRNIKTRLPIIGSDLDKLKVEGAESGKYIAPAIKEALTKRDANEGRWMNPSVEAITSLSTEKQRELYGLMLEEVKTDKNLRDTISDSDILRVYDKQRELLVDVHNDQRANNQPVQEFVKGPKGGWTIVPRLPKDNPNYMFQVPGTKQLDILLNHEGSAAFDILKRDYLAHIKDKYPGFSNDDAIGLFEDFKASYGRRTGGDSTRFGAVRKAEGIGLPNSWLEVNPSIAFKRYWRRVSMDRAWYDAVESDPNNLHILGKAKDSWGKTVVPTKSRISSIPGNETLGGVLDSVQGVNIKTFPKIDALSRIAVNSILGPTTGISDFISTIPLSSRFAPSVFDLPRIYIEAVKGLSQGIKDAKSTGRIKQNVSDIEDIWFPSTEIVERLRRVADGIAKITGRQKLEEWSRGFSQSFGSALIKIHKNLAERGNKNSIKFLTELGNKSDWKTLSDQELASRIVDINQGTYDVRGLPSWVINSHMAPFVRLSKWNIEQLNNLHKHVIIPATQGNMTPLLMTLAGGAIGGELIKQIREKLNAKKSNIPSWTEIYNSSGDSGDKIHAATYALAASLSYSGVLGLMGEMLKSAADVSFKNKPQGFNYPAMEILADTVDNLADVTQAIVQEGENPLEVMPLFAKNLFGNNIQVARLGMNWADEITGDRTKSAKEERRDLRTFRQLSGRSVAPGGVVARETNPYIGVKAKQLQRESDLNTLPKKIATEVAQILKENKGQPEKVESQLNKLKGGAVTTFPSIDSNPKEFAEFYSYLKKTVGEKEARMRLKRYGLERAVGVIRRGMVPSF